MPAEKRRNARKTRGRKTPESEKDFFSITGQAGFPRAESNGKRLRASGVNSRNKPVRASPNSLLRTRHGFFVSLAPFPEIFPALRRSRFLPRHQPDAFPGRLF